MSEAPGFEALSPAGLPDGKLEDNASVNVDAILQSRPRWWQRCWPRSGSDEAAGLDNGAVYVFGLPPVRHFRLHQPFDRRRDAAAADAALKLAGFQPEKVKELGEAH